MEPLEDIDKKSGDESVEHDVETQRVEEPKSTLRKITSVSKLNKAIFKLLGLVVVVSVVVMYVQSKDIKIKQLQSTDQQSGSVNLTTDISQDNDSDVLVPEAHIQASKDAIRKERQEIRETQGQSKVDGTAKIDAIEVYDGGFFDPVSGNSELGLQVGGQSFDFDEDFKQFAVNASPTDTRDGEVENTPRTSTGSSRPNKSVREDESKDGNEQKRANRGEINVYKGVIDLAKIRETSVSTIVANQREKTTVVDNVGGRRNQTMANVDQEANTNSSSRNPRTERYVNPLLTDQPFNSTSTTRSKYASTSDSDTSINGYSNDPYETTNLPSQRNDGRVANRQTQTLPTVTTTHNGLSRGLYVGEKMIGEFDHGISSVSPTMMAIVNISQGPLAGARVIFKPTLAYDTFTYESSVIQYKNHQAPFRAVLVTPDANLQTSYRSGVDYHTLYNLGMVFTVGAFKGSAEFINKVADEIVISDNQVVTTVEFSPIKLLISALGGVADAATPMLEKQLDKPPTVWVNANDLVGIMMVENWNAEWAPIINDNSVGIY
ncbi:TraB/TrbI/VirB10 family type IV secretion system protein [Vibrio parahaemolyticus]|uniref:hypothetical protein n=1 Tax=Vibrio parahaemolyticus TaxID=670 RepID=UPI00081371BF|nr:hypothetical protein [Vibrio parahaemolyticus]OCP68405.1 hypothetical protein AKH08_16470 [Vibrio parahaemolyticus]